MLATWIEANAALHPRAPALISDGRTLDYAALKEQAESDARALLSRGLAPGATLAALSSSPLKLARLAWSVARLGGALLPLNPAWPAARIEAMLEMAGADPVARDEEWEPIGAAVPLPPLAPDPRRIALLVATSGSSGEPKGVMLSEANLEAAVLASRGRIPLDEGDVWLACLPLHHIGGLSILFRCAQAGAAVLLHQGFDPERAMEDMERHHVTHVSLVPAMLARLAELGPPPESLKHALIGGGPLSPTLARRAQEAGWPLCPTYGMSEASSQVATLGAFPEGWREGLAGPPLPGMEVGMDAGTGRIRLRGPMVMAGYLNPAREPGVGLEDGWFLTGDRGFLDGQGNLVVLGRADDMLVSGGVNIHPAEAEALLLACPGVDDAALTALPDPVWGDRLAAVLVSEAEEDAVRDWCRAHMPTHLRPRLFARAPALPRNAMGKLERERLPALVRATIAVENQE